MSKWITSFHEESKLVKWWAYYRAILKVSLRKDCFVIMSQTTTLYCNYLSNIYLPWRTITKRVTSVLLRAVSPTPSAVLDIQHVVNKNLWNELMAIALYLLSIFSKDPTTSSSSILLVISTSYNSKDFICLYLYECINFKMCHKFPSDNPVIYISKNSFL